MSKMVKRLTLILVTVVIVIVILVMIPKQKIEKQFAEKNVTIEPATSTGYYGYLVKGYHSKGKDLQTKQWRLFYQDNNYTYLIMDELGEEYCLENEYEAEPEKYKDGSSVSEIGKRLNAKLLEEAGDTVFTESNMHDNIKAIAWLTDSDNWTEYTDEEGIATYAIGAPTIDLFAASYNNNNSISHSYYKWGGKMELDIQDTGYLTDDMYGYFYKGDSNGIYNKSGEEATWCLASPKQVTNEMVGFEGRNYSTQRCGNFQE